MNDRKSEGYLEIRTVRVNMIMPLIVRDQPVPYYFHLKYFYLILLFTAILDENGK